MPTRRTRTKAKTRRRSATKEEPLLLQTFWTGNPLSRLERAALQSYVNAGYTVHIYTYNPLADFRRQVPPSPRIVVHDAREVLPEEQMFLFTGRKDIGKRADAYSYLPFSDLFRFTMLYKNGGAWIDLDIFLVRPFPAQLVRQPYMFSSERTIQKGAYRKKEPEVTSVAFIKVPGPRSELMTWILDRVPKPTVGADGRSTGGLLDLKSPFDYMNLFRRGIEELGLGRYALPARAIMPLNWWDVKNAFGEGAGRDGTCLRPKYGTEAFCVNELQRADVFAVHWFRAILRRKGVPYEDAHNRGPENNLYERMVQQIEDDAGMPRGTL